MAQTNTAPKVLVVIGTGGMGLAIARRLATGRQLVLADYSDAALKTATTSLEKDGIEARDHKVDVSDYASVEKLAKDAAALGEIETIVHTAGVSPVQASIAQIYRVDLLGTANVIDAFVSVVSSGTSLICIASMAGNFGALSPALEQHLATGSREKLLQHSELDGAADPGQAYVMAKRGNQLRVQGAVRDWGSKGARLNTISPGVISTPMGQQELEGEHGAGMRTLIQLSGAGRVGTVDDIADVAVFLASPASSFITGNDILVDGGAVAGSRWAAALAQAAAGTASQ